MKNNLYSKNVDDLPCKLMSFNHLSSMKIQEILRSCDNLCPIPYIIIIMTQSKLALIDWWWYD